jgi:hypothetical protein
VTQIFHNGQPSYGGDRKIFEVMTSILPKGTLGSVASLLAATLYQGNPGTPVSSTNKTDRHDITEILLYVALSTVSLNQTLE